MRPSRGSSPGVCGSITPAAGQAAREKARTGSLGLCEFQYMTKNVQSGCKLFFEVRADSRQLLAVDLQKDGEGVST